MSLAMLSRYLPFLNFSGVAISAESTSICSLEYSFGSFTNWILSSLYNDCFETISPSINDDFTFLLPFSVFMLIEVLAPDTPSFLSRSSVIKVPWLNASNKANVDNSLSEL